MLVDGPRFRDFLSDLDPDSELVALKMSPDPARFAVATQSAATRAEFSVSKDMDMVEEFISNSQQTCHYKYSQIKPALRTLQTSEKVSLQTGEDGLLCLQFMVKTDTNQMAYIEYFCTPLAMHQNSSFPRQVRKPVFYGISASVRGSKTDFNAYILCRAGEEVRSPGILWIPQLRASGVARNANRKRVTSVLKHDGLSILGGEAQERNTRWRKGCPPKAKRILVKTNLFRATLRQTLGLPLKSVHPWESCCGQELWWALGGEAESKRAPPQEIGSAERLRRSWKGAKVAPPERKRRGEGGLVSFNLVTPALETISIYTWMCSTEYKLGEEPEPEDAGRQSLIILMEKLQPEFSNRLKIRFTFTLGTSYALSYKEENREGKSPCGKVKTKGPRKASKSPWQPPRTMRT
ncbi:unnamed protein product [Nesidiocoris tenuis]|uniref:Uncharacterized protein n=1 Tax=Nesidiocoris tenuis TaxID=355587 RepID=A0A6H5GCJ2_9HEMI|nr:unnamed protein product [Nesidiocoris tenuis]